MSKNVNMTNKLNKTRNSGFTLVEMIVAITIVGIMAAITTLSVISWQDWSRFNRENEYAQAMYVAAQNQLTAYSADGYLEEFTRSLIDPNALKDETITDYSDYYLVDTLSIDGVTGDDGSSLSEEEVWKELDKSGTGKYGNKIIVLSVDKGEYTDSIKLEDAIGHPDLLEKYWVYALLDSYIADKEVLAKGSISIELSPSDGQVFSVLYSDSINTFEYGTDDGITYNARNRKETYRERFMVGYFGVDILTKSVEGPGVSSALNLKKVILNNKEQLYLSFTQDKNTVEVNNTNYDIYLYNSEEDASNPELKIVLNFPAIIAENSNALDGADSARNAKMVKLPVYRYYEAAGYSAPSGETSEYEELGKLPFLIWKTGNSTVNIVLDAVDFQAGTWLYEKDYEAIHGTDYESSVSEFNDTYSYFRFGLNNDNIKCSVVASAPTYSNSSNKFSNSENPVYYSEKQKVLGIFETGYIKRTHAAGEYAYTYAIKNARHLYNIRYTEDVNPLLTPNYVLNNESVSFELINDIDWREFTAYGNVYASNLVDNPNDISAMKIEKEGEADDYYFPSISAFRNNDTLTSRGGLNYVIKRMSISEDANSAGRVSLNREKSSLSGNYEYQAKPATALILLNEGSVKDITLDEMKVEGHDYVAAFIGINAANADREVTNLILDNSNDATEIRGEANVGGIIAFAAPSDPENTAVISGLMNRGSVYGHTAVGGIVGMIRNDYEYLEKPDAVRTEIWSHIKSEQGNLYIKIEDCENYGVVEGITDIDTGDAKELAALAENDRYIGGIAGYCYNTTEIQENETSNRIIISNCISAPLYKDSELPQTKADFDKKLKGVYVGGIVGYNRFGAIEGCSSDTGFGRGYIFGYKYVGGIVGLNIGPANGTEINGSDEGCINANHVFGSQYVGGITGCNAKVSDKLSDGSDVVSLQQDPVRIEAKAAVDGIVPMMLPDENKNVKVAVKNWVNTGVVIATNSYGGGITGFNAGWIYRCKTTINADEAASCLDRIPGSSYLGDYIGGVAGYNNGNIGYTDRDLNGKKKSADAVETQGVTVYVTGKNFVGGIVGYNAEDAIVEDYRVDGGYVHGSYEGSFVGGYAGFNESIDLLMDTEANKPREVYSNPNEITGRFFVGGNIGGNIINTEKRGPSAISNPDKVGHIINSVFKTDNFLGKLEGKAFVGGFVGYNMFYSAADDLQWVTEDEDADRGATFVLTKLIKNNVNSIAGEGDNAELTEAVYQKELDLMDNLSDADKGLGIEYDKSNCVFLISGHEDDTTKNDLGSVSGDIYVGGVFGYNDEDSILYLSSIINGSNVSAAKAIQRDIEQTYEINGSTKIRKTNYLGKTFTYNYSYVGGIIGKNSKNTIIDNCSNASNVTVDTKGTYTGGLCEINEGTIIHCSVSGFGNSVTDYVGGLCGLNKGAGINGDIVGLVTLKDYCELHKDEQFGEKLERGINYCSFKNCTVSGRNVVGGIAAENFGRIKNITLEGSKMLIDGDPNKEGVGGLYAGFNGECGVLVLENDITGITIKSGGSNVGSVTGVNAGKLINQRYYTAKAEMETEPESDAQRSEKNSFYNLLVEDDCKIEGYKNVGGLIGLNLDENDNLVEHYTNKCKIVATHGNAGGIIGSNESGCAIKYCLNAANIAATEDGNAGGITSNNKGDIIECYDYESVNAPKGMSGGIVAVNLKDALIEDCIVEPNPEQADGEIEFISTKAVGGIAASNDGEINENELTGVTVTNYNTTKGTQIGVIAGENLINGVINLGESMPVTDCMAIAETNNCKVGGVAGCNDGLIHGVLNNSTKLPATVISPTIALGDAQYASLGGVAGTNTGIIENISVNTKIEGDLGSGTSGYGGVAGYSGYANASALKKGVSEHKRGEYPSVIRNCSFDGVINAKGSSGSPARVGGIVGINANGSKVLECYLGVLGDDSQTLVTAGDYLNKTDESVDKTDIASYSNTGGIAGENYGWVSACDNNSKSKDQVSIISFAGETGGIVGYNYKYAKVGGYEESSSSVHWLTTGKNWTVDQRCEENDRGPGGVIGKNDSSQDLAYISNYALVKSMYPANNKVGGVIGIMEQTDKSQASFYQIYNYGEVRSINMSGGICGQIRASGAVFRECTNYGDIYCGYRFGGGMVADHNRYTNSIDFYKCYNHGNIQMSELGQSSSSIGGFIGCEEGCLASPVSYFYDCVNTGNVVRVGETYPSQNKMGSFVGTAANKIVFELCRNYNTSNTSANGFVSSGTNAVIKDCLDVTSTKTTSLGNTPFGGSVDSANRAYYLNNVNNEISNKDYGVYFTLHEGPTGSDMKCYDINYTDIKNPALYLKEPDTDSNIKTNNKTPSLVFNVSYSDTSSGMDSFVVYAWNENAAAPNNYDYTAEFTDSNGVSKTATGTMVGDFELKDSRTVIKVPSGLDNKISSISIKFTGTTNVSLRGFSYIPKADTSVEAVCKFAADKHDTSFCLGNAKQTNNGVIKNPSVKVPQGHTYKLRNDLLDINWTGYSYFSYGHDAGAKIDIPISVTNGENASGMESFVFYAGTNNLTVLPESSARTYHYKYSVTMTDINGQSASTDEMEAIGYDGIADWANLGRQEVKLSSLSKQLDSKIKSIVLTINGGYYTTGTNPKQNGNNTVYLRGFAWVPKGGSEEKLAYGGDPEAKTMAAIFASGKRYIKLMVDKSKNSAAPYVYISYDHDSGFDMDANDPSADKYYNDHDSYAVSKAAGTNSRINVYEDIDPKFIKLAASQRMTDNALPDPENLKLEKNRGFYDFSWDAVPDAAGYDVYYVLRDPDGVVQVTSDTVELGSARTNYRISIENDWVEKDYMITCFVTAIHTYHRLNPKAVDYQKYDSNPVSISEALVKKPLPTPVAHLEVIEGNRTVIVLENYDEYVELGCTDCTINFKLNGVDRSWNVQEHGKFSEPFVFEKDQSNFDVLYFAEPNDSISNKFVDSIEYANLGQAATNSTLPGLNLYGSSIYFNGFKGNDINSMSYGIKINLNAGTGDSYQTTDISAYDEALGATAVYDYEVTHTANSTGKGAISFTSTLKNLPQTWFGEKPVSKITARAYLYKSQSNIIFYGHDVCTITTPLNAKAKTAEEIAANQAVFAGIYDDRYFTEDSVVPTRNCVWDAQNNDFKPGYILRKNAEDEYEIIYSSVIAMARENAQAGTNPYRDYTGYAVASVIYSNMEAETGTNISNNLDFTESYWTRGIDANHKYDVSYFNNTVYNNQALSKVQEIMSAPIVESFTTDETSAHIRVHLSWDKYYKDVACFSEADKRYKNNKLITNPDEGEFATYDEYVKRLDKSGTLTVNNDARMRLMSSYYYNYSEASYRVELLGKTISGNEVVIAEKSISSKTQLPSVTGKKTLSGAATTYDVWQYECDFEDSKDNWGNYTEINARIIRIGSDTTGRNNGTIVTDTKAGSTMRLPRYTEAVKTRRIKLNTMSKPSVTLSKEAETGDFITTTLSYDVAFSAITDPNQLEDLGGYLIHFKVKTPAEGQEPTADHYYYVTDVRSKAYPNDQIGLYEEDLIERSSTGNAVIAELKPGEDIFLDYLTNTHKAVIDLSDFKTGELIEVTVQAIARMHAKIYKDGDEGVETEMAIPSRLAVPKIELLSLVTDDEAGMPDYEDAIIERGGSLGNLPNTVTYEEYERGFSFMYDKDDESYVSEPTARIKMSVAVFDSIEEDGQTWDEGAITTIYSKEEPCDLGAVAVGAVYNLDLAEFEDYKGQWAGKYIKVALKAASTSRIDSQWTDEDASEAATTDYKWIHIPKLLLDEIKLHDSTGTLDTSKIDPLTRYYYDGSLHDQKKAESDGAFEQVTIGFNVDANASGYRYTLKGTGIDNGDGNILIPTFEVYAEKNDKQGYEVYIAAIRDASQQEGKDPEDGDAPVCQQNKKAAWLGTLDEDNKSIEFKDVAAVFTLTDILFKGRIMYEPEGDAGMMKLVLPDLQKTDVGTNLKDYICTDAVLVKTYCKEVSDSAYITDVAALWQREVVDGSYTGKNLVTSLSLDEVDNWLEANVGVIVRMTDDADDAEDGVMEDLVEDGTVSENEVACPAPEDEEEEEIDEPDEEFEED